MTELSPMAWMVATPVAMVLAVFGARFVEQALHGGVSMEMHRHAEANRDLICACGVMAATYNFGCVALLALDLDHFKRVNDRHGQLVGDEVLVQTAAERLRAAVTCTPLMVSAGPLPLSVSVGVATVRQPGTEPRDALQRADRALNSAKEAGRDRVVMAA